MPARRIGLALAAAAALAAPAAADEFVITLEGANFVYEGKTNDRIDLVIQPGDSIRWVWVSGQHNVVSGNPGDPDEGDEFDSGDPVFPPFEFVHTFEEAGDFPYFCELHFFVGMVSTVFVRCPGDFNGDLVVNTQDVLAFLNAWNQQKDGGCDPQTDDCSADFNGDGVINTQDVLAFLNAWTSAC